MPIGVGSAPAQIDFTDMSSPGTTSWYWTFGDGQTSILQNPSNTYATVGTYTVTLYATSSAGTAQVTDYVTVGSVFPWTPPAVGSAGVPGTDPQVMLRLSNDGGRTWGAEMMRSAGKQGQWGKRVRWLRLGSARRRVFEVSVTDPVPWRITGAYLDAEVEDDG